MRLFKDIMFLLGRSKKGFKKFEFIGRDCFKFKSNDGNTYIINGERLASREYYFAFSKRGVKIENQDTQLTSEVTDKIIFEVVEEFKRCDLNIEVSI